MASEHIDDEHHHDATAAIRTRRLEALLEERGLIDGATLDLIIDKLLASASPLNGARAIARAWINEGYRERLVHDTYTAFEEIGCTLATDLVMQEIHVVENTNSAHNVVVCTLCSCYPVSILGPSPSWYRNDSYRARVVREPRSVLAEFGLKVPSNMDIRVWDSNARTRYLVLPRRPEGTEGYTEEELTSLVTRKGMIGTAAV